LPGRQAAIVTLYETTNDPASTAGGVHATRGLICSNFHEVPVKQAVLRMAVETHLVADGSKLGRVKPAHFAGLEEFDTLITAPVPENPFPDMADFDIRLVIA
jgi:DeoR family deoxyribose operon repressor